MRDGPESFAERAGSLRRAIPHMGEATRPRFDRGENGGCRSTGAEYSDRKIVRLLDLATNHPVESTNVGVVAAQPAVFRDPPGVHGADACRERCFHVAR